MEVDHELTLMNSSLYEITGDNIILWGKISLAIEIGIIPQTAHHFIEFLVVDYRSAYHEVLGRTSYHEGLGGQFYLSSMREVSNKKWYRHS